ncbi:MAG TPA: SRPBCC family protein [bacterium]|nr:SRPBCC family protein [bacterium]
MPGASTSVVMEVPAKVIYEVVSDFESYPDFLPDVKRTSITKKGKGVQAEFEISVIKTIRYTLDFSLVPNKKVSWTFVKGDVFKDNTGEWIFEEVKKGQTKVTYSVDVDFGLFVPSLITKKLVGSNLPTMMKRFKERAESLA